MSCSVLINPACILSHIPVVGHLIGAIPGAIPGVGAIPGAGGIIGGIPGVGGITGSLAAAGASGVLNGIASGVSAGVTWLVQNSATWWVRVPSPDLASEGAVGSLQQWIIPIAAAVAVFGMIAAAIKMTLTRKANPLIDVGSGLAVIAVTSAVGVALPALLLKAGDAWSNWVLNTTTGGQFASQLTAILALGGATPAAVVIVLGIVAIIISAAQAILMLFRQGALVILAGVLPLAAAGMLTPATRTWFRRVTGWMLALIFYKPAAAAVYGAAFTLIGHGTDARTILMGYAMVLLSLLALPVLMRFFTWSTGAVSESGGGGGFLQTAIGGAVAIGALRGSSGFGGSGAIEQSRLMNDRLGPQAPGPAGAQATGAGHGLRGPAGSAAASGTPGTGETASGSASPGASAGAGAGPGAAGAPGAATAASAAGPAGAAVSGLAAGASSARRRATDAMLSPDSGGNGQ